MITLQKTEFDRIQQEATVINRDEKEKNKTRFQILIYHLLSEEPIERIYVDYFTYDRWDLFGECKFYLHDKLVRSLKYGESFKILYRGEWLKFDVWEKKVKEENEMMKILRRSE